LNLFAGHIQNNAVKSWTLLDPRPDIILFGDDKGTAEIAQELGVRHVTEMDRNEHRLPFVNKLFHHAQMISCAELFMYTNADVMFTNELSNVVSMLLEKRQHGRITISLNRFSNLFFLKIATLLNS
jgi:hypothetical protein